ncbi:MAG: hypothetical protein NTZ53_10675 [Cyanobacteria bacterium]|nr:hypothetical protein [Cyanobacteriota bacterium]
MDLKRSFLGQFTCDKRPKRTFAFSIVIAALTLSPIPLAAKPVTDLAVEWKGMATVTAFGTHSKLHPLNSVNSEKTNKPFGWNAYEEGRTLQVIKQQGRHVEFALITPRGTRAVFVGTMSADGKQLHAADSVRSLILTREGDRLSGCGTVRGGEGSFEN